MPSSSSVFPNDAAPEDQSVHGAKKMLETPQMEDNYGQDAPPLSESSSLDLRLSGLVTRNLKPSPSEELLSYQEDRSIVQQSAPNALMYKRCGRSLIVYVEKPMTVRHLVLELRDSSTYVTRSSTHILHVFLH